MPHRRAARWLWINLALVALIFSVAVSTILVIVILHLNKARLDNIQDARVESCQATYEGVRQVFQVFFPKTPNPRQKADLRKFNNRIDMLKAGCAVQTRVKETP